MGKNVINGVSEISDVILEHKFRLLILFRGLFLTRLIQITNSFGIKKTSSKTYHWLAKFCEKAPFYVYSGQTVELCVLNLALKRI